jgi:hypothetical protein
MRRILVNIEFLNCTMKLCPLKAIVKLEPRSGYFDSGAPARTAMPGYIKPPIYSDNACMIG